MTTPFTYDDEKRKREQKQQTIYRFQVKVGEHLWEDCAEGIAGSSRDVALRRAIRQGIIQPEQGRVVRVFASNNFEDFELAPRQEVDLFAVGFGA